MPESGTTPTGTAPATDMQSAASSPDRVGVTQADIAAAAEFWAEEYGMNTSGYADLATGEVDDETRSLVELLARHRLAALPTTPPAAMVPLAAIPSEIGRVRLSDRLSNGERYCSHSHYIPAGHPVYWPESMGEYEDRDPLCLAHAVEQAESDSGWCECDARDALDDDATPPAADAGEVDMRQLAADLDGIRGNFERIAAHHPNDQPCYRDGVRPFGTGDLRHAIETLAAASVALVPRSHGEAGK